MKEEQIEQKRGNQACCKEEELEGKYCEEYSDNEEVFDVKEEFEEEYGDNYSGKEDKLRDEEVGQVGQVPGTEYFTGALGNVGSFLRGQENKLLNDDPMTPDFLAVRKAGERTPRLQRRGIWPSGLAAVIERRR